MTFIIIILAITLQVYLSVKKVSPFISLLIVSILSGLFLGMQPSAIIQSVESGVGGTLAGLALIICLGAVLGKILESSGAAKKISVTLIKGFGAAKTAPGIVAPLVTATHVSPELLVLAAGSGSVFMSHVNDTAFRMFKEFFNLSL